MKSLLSIIIEAMSPQQAMDILGLKPGFSPDELKKAHRTLAMKNHPDRGGDLEKMKLVNAAKDTLEKNPRSTGYHRNPSSSDVKKDETIEDWKNSPKLIRLIQQLKNSKPIITLYRDSIWDKDKYNFNIAFSPSLRKKYYASIGPAFHGLEIMIRGSIDKVQVSVISKFYNDQAKDRQLAEEVISYISEQAFSTKFQDIQIYNSVEDSFKDSEHI